eukprot:GHVU01038831.1.p1 GENE.GHVU01038831.1~~GHVU01038831.1.p1  ORF type:complete len:267 (+),score=41.13 GHVU01038831.1:116-916(+)
MPALHMINCFLTAYGPPFILSQNTSLKDSGSVGRSVTLYSAAFYLVAQAIKSLLLVLLPAAVASNQNPFIAELFRAPLWWVDYETIRQLRDRAKLSSDNRILAIALGWSLGESLLHNFFSFVIGARGPEFDWGYIKMAAMANVNLLAAIAAATWMEVVALSERSRPDTRDPAHRDEYKSSPSVHIVPMALIHALIIPICSRLMKTSNYARGPVTCQVFAVLISAYLAYSAFASATGGAAAATDANAKAAGRKLQAGAMLGRQQRSS